MCHKVLQNITEFILNVLSSVNGDLLTPLVCAANGLKP